MSLFPPGDTTFDRQQRCFEYVMKGGFPEVWIKNYNTGEYLSALFDSIILKDIVKRYHVRFPTALTDLAQILITNITGEFSTTSIQKIANGWEWVNTKNFHTSVYSMQKTVLNLRRFPYVLKN